MQESCEPFAAARCTCTAREGQREKERLAQQEKELADASKQAEQTRQEMLAERERNEEQTQWKEQAKVLQEKKFTDDLLLEGASDEQVGISVEDTTS